MPFGFPARETIGGCGTRCRFVSGVVYNQIVAERCQFHGNAAPYASRSACNQCNGIHSPRLKRGFSKENSLFVKSRRNAKLQSGQTRRELANSRNARGLTGILDRVCWTCCRKASMKQKAAH